MRNELDHRKTSFDSFETEMSMLFYLVTGLWPKRNEVPKHVRVLKHTKVELVEKVLITSNSISALEMWQLAVKIEQQNLSG